jgi:hypothetical protein
VLRPRRLARPALHGAAWWRRLVDRTVRHTARHTQHRVWSRLNG